MDEIVKLSQEEIGQLMLEWKKRLMLNDWRIELQSYCLQDDDLIVSDGVVDYVEAIKCARIKIIDPAQRSNDALRPYDFEQALVHELLHLKFCLLDGGDMVNSFQGRYVHQLIDELACAFVDAKRG